MVKNAIFDSGKVNIFFFVIFIMFICINNFKHRVSSVFRVFKGGFDAKGVSGEIFNVVCGWG